MTRDEITAMARNCGWAKVGREMEYPVLTGRLERFAALIAAAERETFVKDTRDEEIALLREEIKRLRFCIPEGDAAAAMEYLAYCVEKAVAAEREACAKIAESYEPRCDTCPSGVSTAIRARGT